MRTPSPPKAPSQTKPIRPPKTGRLPLSHPSSTPPSAPGRGCLRSAPRAPPLKDDGLERARRRLNAALLPPPSTAALAALGRAPAFGTLRPRFSSFSFFHFRARRPPAEKPLREAPPGRFNPKKQSRTMNSFQKQTLVELAALMAAVALTALLSGCTSSPELPPEPSGETVPVPRFAPEARADLIPGTFAGLSAPGTAHPGPGFPDARPAAFVPSTPENSGTPADRAAAPLTPKSAAQGD